MGSFYLDVNKDRQYTAKDTGLARRSCQSALYHIAEALVRWMLPVMSATAQEIWEQLPGERGQYIFVEEWYQGLTGLADDAQFSNDYWQQVRVLRDDVNKALEQARRDEKIGGTLDAEVTLYASDELVTLLGRLEDELRFVLITSAATVKPLSEAPDAAVATETDGLKLLVASSEHQKWRALLAQARRCR